MNSLYASTVSSSLTVLQALTWRAFGLALRMFTLEKEVWIEHVTRAAILISRKRIILGLFVIFELLQLKESALGKIAAAFRQRLANS